MTSLGGALSDHPIVSLSIFWGLLVLCVHFFDSRPRPASRDDTNKISSNSKVTKEFYEDLIDDFLRKVSFKSPSFVYDEGLMDRVEAQLQFHGLSDKFIDKVEPYTRTAVDMTFTTYSYLPPKIQEVIAIYTVYVLIIDDLADEFAQDLRAYATSLTSDQSPDNEVLRGLTFFLSQENHLFGSYGGSMLVKSTLDFITASTVEKDQSAVRLSPDSPDYLDYFRFKTGISEGYSMLLFPSCRYPESESLHRYLPAIPPLMHFYNYVNDLMSFYKEESKIDEPLNFIHAQAKLRNIHPLESLKRTQDFAVQAVQRIRRILRNEPDILEDVERFMQGYIHFHLTSKRYRLAELDIPAAVEGTKRLRESSQAN